MLSLNMTQPTLIIDSILCIYALIEDMHGLNNRRKFLVDGERPLFVSRKPNEL